MRVELDVMVRREAGGQAVFRSVRAVGVLTLSIDAVETSEPLLAHEERRVRGLLMDEIEKRLAREQR